MSKETAWEKAAEAQGTTDSERALARLARKAFLSLWSYPNVYSDEGRSGGKGDGKELVDLLVVFGTDVLLFSDKHCEFQSDVDIKVAWPRWYKRAIEKSARHDVPAGDASVTSCKFCAISPPARMISGACNFVVIVGPNKGPRIVVL